MEYQEPPVLFYYWKSSRNQPCRSQERYDWAVNSIPGRRKSHFPASSAKVFSTSWMPWLPSKNCWSVRRKSSPRRKRLALEKETIRLRRELMKGRERQFFEAMRLDMELEDRGKKFAEQEKLTAKITREFVVEVVGK